MCRSCPSISARARVPLAPSRPAAGHAGCFFTSDMRAAALNPHGGPHAAPPSRSRERGQAMFEFATVGLLAFFMIGVCLDVAKVRWVQQRLMAAAEAGHLRLYQSAPTGTEVAKSALRGFGLSQADADAVSGSGPWTAVGKLWGNDITVNCLRSDSDNSVCAQPGNPFIATPPGVSISVPVDLWFGPLLSYMGRVYAPGSPAINQRWTVTKSL